MSKLLELIETLRQEDVQGLENLENMSDRELNHYLKEVGLSSVTPARARGLIASMRPTAGLTTQVNDFRAPLSAAVFDITMTRNSANITSVLPLPLFGALDRESDYVEIINTLMPSGIVVSIDRTADKKGLRYTYTQGANVDTIDVVCQQTPYVNLLRASQGSLFKMQQNKLNISDVAKQSQFSQAVTITNNHMFGKDVKDTFTPNQFKSDLQNQNDIRVINQIIDIDSETSLTFGIIAEAGFTLTLTSFISKYETPRAKGF